MTSTAFTSEWCSEWNVPFNEDKCVTEYTINNLAIQSVHDHRDQVSSVFTWTKHFNTICSKAYCALNLIGRTISSSPSRHIFNCAAKVSLHSTSPVTDNIFFVVMETSNEKKDILTTEQIQRRATKFILDDYHSDYKSRRSRLSLLPVIFWLELQDIFPCKMKNPSGNFSIYDYVSFSWSSTRFSSSIRINKSLNHKTFFPIELSVSGISLHHHWSFSLSPILLLRSILKIISGIISKKTLILPTLAPFISCVHAQVAQYSLHKSPYCISLCYHIQLLEL